MSELVYVVAGSPAPIHRQLRSRVVQSGFTYVRVDGFVSPDRARNLGLAHVRTKFVVFVDNDVIVSPGWLEPLLVCARDTGASIVGLLYLIEIGGKRSIIGPAVTLTSRRPALGATLERVACEFVEFHTMLVSTRFREESDGLDERLLSANEHLCLNRAGSRAAAGRRTSPRIASSSSSGHLIRIARIFTAIFL